MTQCVRSERKLVRARVHVKREVLKVDTRADATSPEPEELEEEPAAEEAKGPEAKEMKGLGILKVAEAIEQAGVGIEDAKKAYRKMSGEEAKRRWAKVDILVGTIASALEEEEE